MKAGRTLQDLATELDRQMKTKKDIVGDTSRFALLSTAFAAPNSSILRVAGYGNFAVNELAHDQIALRLQIPKPYYDRLRTFAPGLLDGNVDYWFANKSERRLLRTVDGRLRAFLSDRYRPLDNYDLTEVVLPVISKLGCRVESCELTERRLYIKAVNERLQADIKVGDAVQAGIVISNSEVGCGSVSIEPMVFRLVCRNGMIANEMSMRKYHVGRGAGGDDEGGVTEFYKDETRKADDKAFWMKVKDVVEASLTEALFKQIVGKMQKAQGIEIKGDPVKAVEVVCKRHLLNKDEQSGILKFLVQGGDLTLYGMVNAITRESQEVPDYDRATELERLGGEMLSNPMAEILK